MNTVLKSYIDNLNTKISWIGLFIILLVFNIDLYYGVYYLPDLDFIENIRIYSSDLIRSTTICMAYSFFLYSFLFYFFGFKYFKIKNIFKNQTLSVIVVMLVGVLMYFILNGFFDINDKRNDFTTGNLIRIIFAGTFEELFLRVFILTSLIKLFANYKKKRVWIAVILSSFLFMIEHLYAYIKNDNVSVIMFAFMFIYSVSISWIYLKFSNLFLISILHIYCNLIMLYLPLKSPGVGIGTFFFHILIIIVAIYGDKWIKRYNSVTSRI